MTPDETTAAELSRCLERLAAGDLGARGTIIELCSDRLRTLASRMLSRFPNVRRWEDTDDVFQNSAMRLHRALGQLKVESPRSVMALAATQIHRELIDLARRHGRPGSFAANHGTRARGPDDPAAVERASVSDEVLDRWTLFHEAIQRLPAELREIFQLVWYLGADQRTIAGLLDCSERTVKTRWREAREAVKDVLDGQSPE